MLDTASISHYLIQSSRFREQYDAFRSSCGENFDVKYTEERRVKMTEYIKFATKKGYNSVRMWK